MEIATLHHITQDLEGTSHAEQALKACEGGARWVQLRVKGKSFEEWRVIAQETKSICDKFDATFIINDSVDIALAVDADGVHLGKSDLSPAAAREKLGPDKIIGGTANTFEDVANLASLGVNYVGVGPFRFTKTKDNLSPILGLEGYNQLLQKCAAAGINLPIIAIGGIQVSDVSELMETAVHGIAVSSAINGAENATSSAKAFVTALKKQLV